MYEKGVRRVKEMNNSEKDRSVIVLASFICKRRGKGDEKERKQRNKKQNKLPLLSFILSLLSQPRCNKLALLKTRSVTLSFSCWMVFEYDKSPHSACD
mmetsp:Transcript_1647/g.3383  ORF Transcript_1647/g.3383 Transcript_1647/m.3383 type:complete len:98 (-) Transcript_1647:138-431(-)